MPHPTGNYDAPLKALIFDSWYDPYRGVVMLVRVVDGTIHFDRLRIPVRPMVGVLATATDGPPIGSAYCGRHGGNMDNNRIRPGTRVHLPVRVPGAHLYVGDVHASMGDGEVCGTGVEIGARPPCRRAQR